MVMFGSQIVQTLTDGEEVCSGTRHLIICRLSSRLWKLLLRLLVHFWTRRFVSFWEKVFCLSSYLFLLKSYFLFNLYQAEELEIEAYPLLDELTSTISTSNLERVPETEK
jgi:hypothetical protein